LLKLNYIGAFASNLTLTKERITAMAKTEKYGKIRWFRILPARDNLNNYQFVLKNKKRHVLLLEYQDNWSNVPRVIKLFPKNALEDKFDKTVQQCRQIIGDEVVLWIQSPEWRLNRSSKFMQRDRIDWSQFRTERPEEWLDPRVLNEVLNEFD